MNPLVRRFWKKYLKDISKKIKTTSWYFFDATRVWKSTKWKWQKNFFFFLRDKKENEKSYERTCGIFLWLFSLRQLVNKFHRIFFPLNFLFLFSKEFFSYLEIILLLTNHATVCGFICQSNVCCLNVKWFKWFYKTFLKSLFQAYLFNCNSLGNYYKNSQVVWR